MMRNTMQVSLLGDSRVHTVSNGFENSPSIFFLLYISMQLAMCQRIGNMPKACPYVWVKSLLLLIDG